MTEALGGVILCGGKSSRMGRPKALLPFGEEVLLQRVIRRLTPAVGPIVVVRAPDQRLPPLPDSVETISDDREGSGPLEGIRCGLHALSGQAAAAFVMSCDAPFMSAQIVQKLADIKGRAGVGICIPQDDRYHYPLAAIYDTSLSALASELLSAGKRRPIALLDRVSHTCVPVESLKGVDPELSAFINVNDQDSYVQALRRAGLSPLEESS